VETRLEFIRSEMSLISCPSWIWGSSESQKTRRFTDKRWRGQIREEENWGMGLARCYRWWVWSSCRSLSKSKPSFSRLNLHQMPRWTLLSRDRRFVPKILEKFQTKCTTGVVATLASWA
jgi:hypothetical protein